MDSLAFEWYLNPTTPSIFMLINVVWEVYGLRAGASGGRREASYVASTTKYPECFQLDSLFKRLRTPELRFVTWFF